MKTIKYSALVIAFTLLFSGCKKEEAALTPSELTVQYQLPQGNHDYDPTIVSLNQRYGSFFLYKFGLLDFTYAPVYIPGGFTDTYTVDQPDEAYVGKVLTFLQNNWLNYYPDAFLKANLPFKVLMGQNLRTKATTPTYYTVLSNYNQMTVSNVSAAFDAMTAAQKKTYVNTLHTEFFNYILNRGKLDVPAEFSTVTNYTLPGSTTLYYAQGYLSITNAFATENKMIKDFLSYIALITSKTKSELDATVLKSTTDTAGLIKKKYDIIINYYKTKYNIDLQAIGNAGVI
ncbi:putative zinc-binding metallopeptidase [Pedobacter agri]|uniref:putative zinc-binding metallopeptidase n=1 Tax=Pedobacter agri TaxID=454586 RepID=UPI0029310D04|nr:putative zinc-binding metallopeptidase [Pedobacter agri]